MPFICQSCGTKFKIPFAGPCPDCGGNTTTVEGEKISGPSEAEMQNNLTQYLMRQQMNNLEFMHTYKVEKLTISDLSNENLIAFRIEVARRIELDKIRMQAAEHLLKERGAKFKSEIERRDMQYIPPTEKQKEAIAKKLSKKGESAANIAKLNGIVDDSLFDDI